MTNTYECNRGQKRISSSLSSKLGAAKEDTRYDLENAGPNVRKKGEKLLEKSINIRRGRNVAVAMTTRGRPLIESNVRPSITASVSEASVSGMTSAADQYIAYHFEEASATTTYTKMMTIHLKDKMFSGMKFISNDGQLEYSKSEGTICGYVCTQMRVPLYQWGEYWKLMKEPTKKMIEQQCTNATSAIKKGFRGTYEIRAC